MHTKLFGNLGLEDMVSLVIICLHNLYEYHIIYKCRNVIYIDRCNLDFFSFVLVNLFGYVLALPKVGPTRTCFFVCLIPHDN